MKMIIGGSYQGQLQWAKEHYNDITWADGRDCPLDDVFFCQGIYDFHILIRRMLQNDKDLSAKELADKIVQENPELIIVSNEIGYGLVPVDAFDRTWREVTGRVCTELAAFSEEVTRVIMGISARIK